MLSNVPQSKWPINSLSLHYSKKQKKREKLNPFLLQEVLHVVTRLGFIRVLT